MTDTPDHMDETPLSAGSAEPESEVAPATAAPFIDPEPQVPSPGWLSEHPPEPVDAVVPLSGDTVEFEPVEPNEEATEEATEEAEVRAFETAEFSTVYDLGGPRELELVPEERPRRALWVAVAAMAIVVVVVSGYALWRGARPVSVPDLTGRGPAEATQMLNDFSLRLGSVSETPTESVAPGTVVTQKPAAGDRLTAGERVSIVVAVAPDRAKVPSVTGRTRASAVSAAASSKLVPRIVETYSTSVGEGNVIAQLPAAGLELAPGEPLVIMVSKGPAPASVIVPRLDGLTEAEANQLLAANRLKGVFYRSYDANVRSGDIIGQTPLARTSAPWGSIVQVLVSQGDGSMSVVVPNVAGDTESGALASLRTAGLTGSVTKSTSASVAAGRVISQMPGPGRGVASGATVGLLVSTGPAADVNAPGVTGQATAQATEAIKALGVDLVVVEVNVAGATANQVWAQYPEPGQAVAPGSPMVLMVTRAATP